MSKPIFLILILATVAVSGAERDPHLAFFETKVRPLLSAECYECHSETKSKGGLRLDHIDFILEGGETGPAISPGIPGGSLLVAAIRKEEADFGMPPKKTLTSEQVKILEEWIELGAPWPKEEAIRVETDENGFTAEDHEWWAIQPLAEVTPPSFETEWIRNEVDAFVLSSLRAKGLEPAEPASGEELVRRIYFDLHGLPPSPDEVATFLRAFLADPDKAVADLVERLLGSPRYGERWGQHWLDVVRYAESDGYRADDYRPETWRYRDYVIRSFNEDKPYHQFVREQLAADEMDLDDPETLVATAFLRLGVYEWNQRNARMQWDLIMTEMTNVTSEAFLGLGMGCAQCHDHKFDPILQKDYFALQSFLNATWWPEDEPLGTAAEKKAFREKDQTWKAATLEIREELEKLRKAKT
ncbi:MAG: DUF1549 domain-containing protein, partial [Verrucomicrobiota bacterium]